MNDANDSDIPDETPTSSEAATTPSRPSLHPILWSFGLTLITAVILAIFAR